MPPAAQRAHGASTKINVDDPIYGLGLELVSTDHLSEMIRVAVVDS